MIRSRLRLIQGSGFLALALVGLALFLLVVRGAPQAAADQGNPPREWRPLHGPPGGRVGEVAFHPTNPHIAYAATDGGIYRSADGGQIWQPAVSGLPASGRALRLAISSSAPDGVLVAVEGQGVYRSWDAGQTWTLLVSGGYRGVQALAASPHYAEDQTALLTWADFGTGDGAQFGVVRLVGDHAETVLTEFAPRVAFAPDNDGPGPHLDVLLAAGDWVRASYDNGTTWLAWTSPASGVGVAGLAVSPHFERDHTVFAATYESSSNTATGLFKSTDRGQTWTRTTATIPLTITLTSLALSPDYDETDAAHRTLYAAGYSVGGYDGPAPVYRSRDGAQTWESIGQGLPPPGKYEGVSLAVSPGHPADQTLLFANSQGVFRSTDAGQTWTHSDQGIGATWVSSLSVVSSTLFAAVHPVSDRDYQLTQILRSRDGGVTWQRATGEGFPTPRLGLCCAWPPPPIQYSPAVFGLADGRTVFGWIDPTIVGFGLYRSRDAGDTWQPVPGITATISSRVYTPSVTFMRTAPLSPGRLYLGTNVGPYRSDDSGEHWTRLMAGLPPRSDGEVAYEVQAMTVDAADSNRVYLLGRQDDRLYRSPDGGASWSQLATRPPPFRPGLLLREGSLAAHPTRPGWLYVSDGPYVSLPHNQLLLTRDGGLTWQDLSAYLPPDVGILKRVFVSRAHPDRLWALGTPNYDSRYPPFVGRLYRSDDNGLTWQPDLDLSGVAVETLAVDTEEVVYAATRGRGVWVWRDSLLYRLFLPWLRQNSYN